MEDQAQTSLSLTFCEIQFATWLRETAARFAFQLDAVRKAEYTEAIIADMLADAMSERPGRDPHLMKRKFAESRGYRIANLKDEVSEFHTLWNRYIPASVLFNERDFSELLTRAADKYRNLGLGK